MTIKRIKPPTYRVGRYTLNEYELRNLMLEVAKGQQPHGIKVKDMEGRVVTILPNGRLSENVYGMDIASKLTLSCMPYWKQSKPLN